MEPVYLSDIIQKANENNKMTELESAIRKIDQGYRHLDTSQPKIYHAYVMAVGKVYADLVNKVKY